MNGKKCRNCHEKLPGPTGLCPECDALVGWVDWSRQNGTDYLHGASHAGTMEDPYPTTGEMGQ